MLLLLLLGGVHAYSSSPNDDSRPGECTYIRGGGGAKREEKQRGGKRREEKRREGTGREDKGREGKGVDEERRRLKCRER